MLTCLLFEVASSRVDGNLNRDVAADDIDLAGQD